MECLIEENTMNDLKKKYIENNLHHIKHGKIIDLSNEELSINDYQWLFSIIKRSSFVERIILPSSHRHSIGIVIETLHLAILNNSTLTEFNFDLSNYGNNIPENISFLHQQIQSRLQKNSKKIFAIYGGGNIGLGLMADIISKSSANYNIVATSNNGFLHRLINSKKQLWLQHGPSIDSETTCVNNVTLVSRNRDDVVKLFSEACLASICVTPTVLHEIANDIAAALIKRYELDGSGLKILVLMNIPNCDKFSYEKIKKEILSITKDERYTDKILSGIEFIQTVIDRIVTPISEEIVKNQLKKQLIEASSIESELFQEDTNYKIDEIINNPEILESAVVNLNLKFNLFNAEKSFSMYVEDSFPEARRLPLIKTTRDLSQIEAIKNKYINGPHAVLAWAGALLGYTTISESVKNPFIFRFIKEMMEYEIAPILTAEYPDISKNVLEELEASFFTRCLESIDDPVTRVGRDPLRKLDAGGRIRGTIELAQKLKLSISTQRLEHGIAAGLLYAINKIDANNPGCQKILDLFKSNSNSFVSVLCYKGAAPGGSFSGLHPNKDGRLINSVLVKIDTINQWRASSQLNGISPAVLNTSKSTVWPIIVLPSKSIFTKVDNSKCRFFFAATKFHDERSNDTSTPPRQLMPSNRSLALSQASKHTLWYKALAKEKRMSINLHEQYLPPKISNTLK